MGELLRMCANVKFIFHTYVVVKGNLLFFNLLGKNSAPILEHQNDICVTMFVCVMIFLFYLKTFFKDFN